ncbi:aspartic peptidase domain-containing protein [Xylariaceae sp. FL0594]|nr:aspartic peptidase domain-containing protein [Xylariaceae sp. FL0594]
MMWTPILTFLVGFLSSVPALAGASTVADSVDITQGNTFSVPLSHNVNIARHGPSELLKTLKKYKQKIPEGLQEVVDKHHDRLSLLAMTDDNGTGTVPADSREGDLLWLAPITIGTPPQKLFVDIDTGSTDSWFFSTETVKNDVNGQVLWDIKDSSTASLIKGCSWNILYGDWSTSSGTCYKDSFGLGNLTVPNMTIGSATDVSSMFTATSYMSGIVGLAWPKLRQTVPPQDSLIDLLPDVLDNPLFTVDFRHNSSKGSFNFGYIDETLHKSDIVYANVDTSEGYWTVKNTAFGVGKENLTYSFLSPKNMILDTGTTLLFGVQAAVDTYYSKVPGSKYSSSEYGYVVPCDAELPDFLWEITDDDGNVVTGGVPGAYLVYAHTTDELCYGGLQGLDPFSGGISGIFGDIFLKSGFFVFDIKGKRIGAASKTLNLSNGEDEAEVSLGTVRRDNKIAFI